MEIALGWHRTFVCKAGGHIHSSEETEIACLANTLAALQGEFATPEDVADLKRLVEQGRL